MLERADDFHPGAFLRQFRLQMFWGVAAAVALCIAVLSSQSEAGAQRLANALASLMGSRQTAPSFDAETATRQLAQAVRDLRQDRDRLTARLAAIEHDIDDMTGSISKQLERAKAERSEAAALWPEDQQTNAALAALFAALPSASDGLAEAAAPVDTTTVPHPAAYGADIGGSASIKTLQARWTALRAAHPHLFEGLHASLALHEGARSSRTELRLLVGPFVSADAAAKLCLTLAAFKQACQPAMFDGRLALQ